MHDDQHATAIVVLAGLINSCLITKRTLCNLKVAILGAGASASGAARLLTSYGIKNVIMVDSKGIIHPDRTDMDPNKIDLARVTNPNGIAGGLNEALKDADCVIGLASAGLLNQAHIRLMAKDPIVFALSNPTPEIMPDEAKAAGAAIVATGRSDFENQINNALVFPGLFRGALDARVPSCGSVGAFSNGTDT
jgi:malate dehydrogenase (oxaloacetate-decarboxylating)